MRFVGTSSQEAISFVNATSFTFRNASILQQKEVEKKEKEEEEEEEEEGEVVKEDTNNNVKKKRESRIECLHSKLDTFGKYKIKLSISTDYMYINTFLTIPFTHAHFRPLF